MNREKLFSFLLAFVLVFLFACTPASVQTPVAKSETSAVQTTEQSAVGTKPAKNIKVALVLSGAANDGSFNETAYSGLMAAQKKYGIETAYSENVQTADAESAFRDYASKGYNVVIGHGSQYSDAILTVAKEFPNVYFAITNADVDAANVEGLDTKNEETGYISGYVLGKLSKTKKIAFLGSMQIVALLRSEAGFKQGAKDACPDCEVVSAWTGSFYDPVKDKATVESLTQQHVDGLQDGADLGGIDGCKAYGCFATYMGGTVNVIPQAPETVVVSIYNSLDVVILDLVKDVMDGTFKSNTVRMYGFDTGVYSAALNLPVLEKNLSAADINDINNVITKLKNNQITLPHLPATQ